MPALLACPGGLSSSHEREKAADDPRCLSGRDRRAHLLLRYLDDIVEMTVDLTPIFETGHLYEPLLKSHALFATLRVNEDGNALEFANGLEISALWIERLPDQ